MSEQHPDWMVEGARRLANEAEALLRRHEHEDHDGDTCVPERAGMVAYFAHRLGVRDRDSIIMMIESLAEYEARHVEHERDHAH